MSSTEATESPAEVEKKLGNDAFAKKDFEKAIEHYNAAIKLDDSKATYYSNLSACYASLKKWEEAMDAALNCVSKDNKFVKGYLRLAAAQTELKLYDDAEKTLRAALVLEPRTCPLSIWSLHFNKHYSWIHLLPSSLN
jgi:tetratricopeptide (TPR) repeat protein